MTRGAAANAILDAGRSKKRLSPSPQPPTHLRPAALPPSSSSSFSGLVHSFRLSSPFVQRFLRGLFPPSFFCSARVRSRPPTPSFCLFILSLSLPLPLPLPCFSLSLLPSFASFCRFLALCTPNARPFLLPFSLASPSLFLFGGFLVGYPASLPISSSSRLMPRDRQMMIKKAPLRVRTTPRRSTPSLCAPLRPALARFGPLRPAPTRATTLRTLSPPPTPPPSLAHTPFLSSFLLDFPTLPPSVFSLVAWFPF